MTQGERDRREAGAKAGLKGQDPTLGMAQRGENTVTGLNKSPQIASNISAPAVGCRRAI